MPRQTKKKIVRNHDKSNKQMYIVLGTLILSLAITVILDLLIKHTTLLHESGSDNNMIGLLLVPSLFMAFVSFTLLIFLITTRIFKPRVSVAVVMIVAILLILAFWLIDKSSGDGAFDSCRSSGGNILLCNELESIELDEVSEPDDEEAGIEIDTDDASTEL